MSQSGQDDVFLTNRKESVTMIVIEDKLEFGVNLTETH